jgi:hypothetical protein
MLEFRSSLKDSGSFSDTLIGFKPTNFPSNSVLRVITEIKLKNISGSKKKVNLHEPIVYGCRVLTDC